KEEVQGAYNNLLARVVSLSLSTPRNALLEALQRPSPRSPSDPESCQGAIARLDPVPLDQQVAALEKNCVDDLKSLLDALFKSDETDPLGAMSSAVARLKLLSPLTSASLPPDCKYDLASHALRCGPKLLVPPGARVTVPQSIIKNAPDNGLLTFTVSFADT